MTKILVFGMTQTYGGVESFFMNYYRRLDRTQLHFDFLCITEEKIAYEDEILKTGSGIYRITARSKNPVRFQTDAERFFAHCGKEYDVFWMNDTTLANITYLRLAKKAGIRKRIIHAHNSRNMSSRLQGMLHRLHKGMIQKYATDFWACSEEAADFFYPAAVRQQVAVISNAIDAAGMRFKEASRKTKRADLHWENQYIIGNVGRLHFQKNQMFMLDIMADLRGRMPDARLLLIGSGPDLEKLKARIRELQLTGLVRLVGTQTDVADWLSAMDLFLFPSLFEGLGIAALEAQANGIPVLASEGVIPTNVKINPNYQTEPLSKGAAQWADKLISMRDNTARIPAEDAQRYFRESGFEITEAAETLQQLLCNLRSPQERERILLNFEPISIREVLGMGKQQNKQKHAGGKAAQDAAVILQSVGYRELSYKIYVEKLGFLSRINHHYLAFKMQIPAHSAVFLQHPFYVDGFIQKKLYRELHQLKKDKDIRFIVLVHDLNSLRYQLTAARPARELQQYQDQMICSLADILIVHNEAMKAYLIKRYQLNPAKLVCLKLFDYLTQGKQAASYEKQSSTEFPHKCFRNRICYAGNLMPSKSGFLYDFADKIPEDISLYLYGVSFDQRAGKNNILYQGAFPADTLPDQMQGDYGLVWDGAAADTCSGDTGNYLKYNNPHKMSLYIAAGKPVIIWDEAAQAEFVKEHGIGIAIKSLEQLPEILYDISEDEYQDMCNKLAGLQNRVKKGQYLSDAAMQAMQLLTD